ncbi:MAG: MFS transporter [Deltaproteobacteria bacterium]|jgi:MFS family permease|nr:MFS transporter [Deltaproteobacteria bacterium]
MTDIAPDEKQKRPRVRLGRNYWKLWSSSVISNLGDGVTAIALPWLSSAVTRNAVLIALVGVAGRIPWLVFTLPAGVITDRFDRRRLMIWAQFARFLLMFGGAAVVLSYQDTLPAPDAVQEGIVSENMVLYAVIVVVALLFGFAEVLYDNSAQTILPAIVEADALERANGNLWGAELVTNSFLGPPLGSLLIGIAFALPFFFDAGTFAVAAGLIFLISGSFVAKERTAAQSGGRVDWWGEIKEGVVWLWHHPLLRPMAIILGLLNGLGMVTFATFVLFAQEVLGIDAFLFAVLGMSGAIGGVLGSLLSPRISKALGSGMSLYLTIIASVVTSLVIGLTSNWIVVFVMFASFTFVAVLWNVITVSLRQTIIPDELLGRVNSVYRFFAWGMMPIGLAVGGLIVSGMEAAGASRELALRAPWFFAAGAFALLFVYAAPRLTTEKIESARAEGIAAKEAVADSEPAEADGDGGDAPDG